MNIVHEIGMAPGLRGLPRPLKIKPSPDQCDIGQLSAEGLAMQDAVRIKSAELWLMLGESDLASRELEGLSDRGTRHPWGLRVSMAVFSALSFS